MVSSPSFDATMRRPLFGKRQADVGGGDLPGHLSIDKIPAWDDYGPSNKVNLGLLCL